MGYLSDLLDAYVKKLILMHYFHMDYPVDEVIIPEVLAFHLAHSVEGAVYVSRKTNQLARGQQIEIVKLT